MATGIETDGSATNDRPFKGFTGLLCPECGNPDAAVRMYLSTMECCCSECDWEGTAKQAVVKMAVQLAKWQAVARWVEMAPSAL